jgi:hypothetical protein
MSGESSKEKSDNGCEGVGKTKRESYLGVTGRGPSGVLRDCVVCCESGTSKSGKALSGERGWAERRRVCMIKVTIVWLRRSIM